ncbi:transglycosylase SLT domain-containing protein [Cohnella sp. CFH 77786]|uniref:lytic transglycosylase domain-containing protein n=1 Tax=Cohnella sp. CFH 77786 TaxID=2662265 RepID=UPI001C60EBEC|nr:lytic transglycosylase domain-containing protein [Cohnella sp. CFH 77786]MBW5449100.1 transglycosylase SLT domain-containing protein [Cohnella sp. CFH 77786]
MSKRKKSVWNRKRLFLLGLIVVLAALFIRSEWIGRLIYPVSYAEEIRQNARLYGLDPLLIAAIIRVESNYKENAVSPKGAIGIMQLMPDTAAWILKQDRFGDLTVADAGSRADAGIRLGSWYVKELRRQFGDNLPAVLAAYNAGPNRVRKWMEDKVWDGNESTVQNIPYGETRHYVQRVMYYYRKYQEIYDEWDRTD